MPFRKIAAGLIAALAGIFILQNLATMEAGFLWWSFRAPRAVLLFMAFGAGVLVGLLLGHFPRPRRLSDR